MRLGSLCTGIGGLDLAAEAHFGAETIWCAEWEQHLDPIIQRHFGPVLNLRDLTTVAWDELEPVDVLTAGYPCQPFSHAGKRQGADDVRHLWPHIAEAVRVLRPRWVVLENVAGHLSLGFGEVLRDLAEAGFDAEWSLLRASDVGAPHRRERVFIVATDARSERLGEVGHADLSPRCDAVRFRPADQRERPWEVAGDRSCEAAPDADRQQPQGVGDREGLGRRPNGGAHDTERIGLQGRDDPRGGEGLGAPGREPARAHPEVAWGDYAAAIGRWEAVLGRPAPRPTDDRGRLNPTFVEWMMGYPASWVDGLTRTQALKALGNAVVAQQALAALNELAHLEQEAVA